MKLDSNSECAKHCCVLF